MVEEWKTLHVAEELPTELDTRNKTEMLTQKVFNGYDCSKAVTF